MIPLLHLVTDDRVLEAPGFLDRVAGVVEAVETAPGRDVAVHVRGPGLSGRRLWELTRELSRILAGSGVHLLVNDRVDVAIAAGADGVHLGRRSLPPRKARTLLGAEALLGRSVHAAGEVEALAGQEALGLLDYLVAGTIYATPSHPERPAAGPDRVREVRAAAPAIPVVAIGGVTADRVPELLDAGAQGVAVLREVWDAPDPGAATSSLRDALRSAGRTCTGTPAGLEGSHRVEEVSLMTSEAPGGPRGTTDRAGTRVPILVNGQERRVTAGTTVTGLLEELGLVPALVVVEHNREILDRSAYGEKVLEKGDRLELVHFVGGG